MNKQKSILATILLAALFVAFLMANKDIAKPIRLETSGVLSQLTIDDKIYASDIIIIGQVEEVLPSKWNTSRAINAKDLTAKEIIDTGLGIFTDVMVKDNKVLKGEVIENLGVRVRSFTGTIENISFTGSSEPSYELGQAYLLFLHKDDGPTQAVDSGDYIAVNAINGVYKIVGNKAISSDDEWYLDDLVIYIQESPLSAPVTNILETPEAEQIWKTIEMAYDIEARAAYDFNTESFSSVFANNASYVVNLDRLEFVRNFTGNDSLELPGYLDYKIAYYNWWRDSNLKFEALNAKAKSENRDVTQDELKNLIDSEWAETWGLAPARGERPVREDVVQLISIEVNSDNAVVYLHDGTRIVVLYLVEIDNQWYIVGDKSISYSFLIAVSR